MEKKYPDTDFNAINVGQIGFSSWQGLEFYKKYLLGKINADMVIIAYGVNDVDKFRFFYTSTLPDKDEFSKPKENWQISLQNILIRFNSINLLSRTIFKYADGLMCLQKNIPVRRVDDNDFVANIDEIIRLSKLNGSEVILLTSPYNLPTYNIKDPDYEKYQNTDYCYEKNINERKKIIEKDRQLEPKRIAKDINILNNLLRNISKRDNITLVDAEKILNTFKENNMFIDPIHMSKAGNEKIAQNIFSAITEKSLIINKNMGN